MSDKRAGKGASKTVSSRSKSLSETVVAVFPDGNTGQKALKALELAIDKSISRIECISFEQLDFQDLKALEKFYSAPVVVVDVTQRQYEVCLFYQIGLRESFGMKHNIVTWADQDCSKGSFLPPAGVSKYCAV